MRVQLVPLDGGRPLDLVKDLTLVGRQDDCDLQLDHKSVSKMHCVLVKADGMLFCAISAAPTERVSTVSAYAELP